MKNYSAFAHSCIGESHIRRDMICQDSSLAENHGSYAFAAAADGHGSLQYLRTEKGSRFAVECAHECVNEFLESLEDAEEVLCDERQRGQLFDQLWRSIVSRWHDRAEKDFTENPFTEEELAKIPPRYAYYRDRYLSGDYIGAYGTTLAFAAVTEKFAFGAQIGDGKCVAVDSSGEAGEPIPDDPRCYANVTTSMCQDDAVLSARYFYYGADELPSAIFLGTDGIENSYAGREQLHAFYRGLALTFAENGLEEGVRQLEEFLPEMTRKGSGDDVSCAGIICLDELKKSSELLRAGVEIHEDAPQTENNDSENNNE